MKFSGIRLCKLAVLLLFASLLFTNCNSVLSSGTNCKVFKIAGSPKDFVETCYVDNQVITNTTGFSPTENQSLEAYLASQGFTKADSCHCEARLILWERMNPLDTGELIGIVEGASKKGKGVGKGDGVSLNYEIALPEDTSIHVSTETLPGDNVSNPVALVPVGVVDAGVNQHNKLAPFLRTSVNEYCDGKADHALGIDMVNRPQQIIPLDLHGHGSHVNGIIAGASSPLGGDNMQVQIELVNAKASIDNQPVINLFKATCALYYLMEQEAKVINISWGLMDTIPPAIMIPALFEAYEKGVSLVAGIGNDYSPMDSSHYFWPASFSSPKVNLDFDIETPGPVIMLAVGAYNQNNDRLADFSNWGDVIDLSAPAVKIISTGKDVDTFKESSGSSMATAYVSRSAAIIAGLIPNISPAEIKECLVSSADLGNGRPNTSYTRTPVLNHKRAILSCKGTAP